MELRLHCVEVFRLTDPVQKAAAVLALAPPPTTWTGCELPRKRPNTSPYCTTTCVLDATPIIQAKLRKVGTAHALAAVAILDTILEEEVGHVAIGNHWLCQRNQLDPLAFYRQVAEQHGAPKPKPPFNVGARRLAGFSDAELAALSTVTAT